MFVRNKVFRNGVFQNNARSWALSIYEKNPEISVIAKVEFPIGKKLFHLVVSPGTWRCPTVDLELVQTTRNVNGKRHSVRKFQSGKRDHLYRFSTFSGNFPVGRTNETCSIYRRTGSRTSNVIDDEKFFVLSEWKCT